MPTSVSPRCSIMRQRGGQQRRARRRGSVSVLRGRVRQRVRPRRAREVVEAQAQHDRAPDAARGAHPPGDPVDERDERRRRPPPATRGARPSARCDADRAAPAADAGPAAGRGCARARGGAGPTRGRASRRARASPSRGDLADGRDPAARAACAAVTGPTPHSRSTGSGCRKASSPSGGTTSSPSGLATPLATLARNFVRATPTVIGRPTRSQHLAPQPHGDLDRRAREPRSSPRTSRNASSIERPSTSGVVSSKTANTALLASA